MIELIILTQILRATSILESPTANLPKDPIFWQIGTSTSFSLSSKYDPHPSDLDLNGFVSFNGRWFLGLNIFTLNEISLDFGTILLSESEKSPLGISFGLRNVSWKKYISSAGGEPEKGGGFIDENYPALRSPEFLSFYGVLSKHINSFFIFHLGFGRGEFIGYGPRSKFLNTDFFSGIPHEYFTFGLFGTIEFHLKPSLHMALEVDGRDMNFGFLIDVEKFKFILEAQKIEHFISGAYPKLSPRFNAGLAITSRVIFPEVRPVLVKFEIVNRETKTLVKGAVIKFLQTEIPSLITDEKGIAYLNLLPGTYMVSITHPEFKDLKAKLNIKKDKPVSTKIALEPKVSKKDIAAQKIKEGDALLREEKLLEAMNVYKEALNIYPESNTAQERLLNVERAIRNKILELKARAKYFEGKGDYKSAIIYYNDVLKISPEDIEAKDKISELEKKTKEPSPVVEKKVEAKKEEPKRPTKAQIESTLNKAIQEFGKGNYKEAKRLLQEVLKWDPGNSKAQEYLKKTEARLKVLGE